MAKIDSSIYLRDRGPNIIQSAMSGYKQGLDLKTRSMQNKLIEGQTKLKAAQDMLRGATNQESYDLKRLEADKLGHSTFEGAPAKYSKDWVDNKSLSLMSISDRFAIELKKQSNQISAMKAGLLPKEGGGYERDPEFIDMARDTRQMKSVLLGHQLSKAQREQPRYEEKQRKKARKTAFDMTQKLRKERSSLQTTKATQAISAAYNKVQAAAKSPSAAGDLALIFNYMKILDPGSVVRESEFRSAASARAWLTKTEENGFTIPGFVKQGIQKLESGQFLLPEQRADFVEKAGEVYNSQVDVQRRVDNQYKNIANQYGISPKDVLLDFRANVPSKKQKRSKRDNEAIRWAKKNKGTDAALKIFELNGLNSDGK